MTSIITEKITRLLTDKDTEKRRQGANEIEQKTRQLSLDKKRDVLIIHLPIKKLFLLFYRIYYNLFLI